MAEAAGISPLPLMERLQSGKGGGKSTTDSRRSVKRETSHSSSSPSAKKPRVDGGSKVVRRHSVEGGSRLGRRCSSTASESDSLVCSLRTCAKKITLRSEKHVEIQAGLPERDLTRFLQKCAVKWTQRGEAVLHELCWKEVLRNARARNPKRVSIKMSAEEKVLVKEASKTAEFHDSLEQTRKEAARIATLLTRAEHCIVFTGAGISTSAGIGDYRGKSGKWTEMDREAVTAMVAENLEEESEGTKSSEEGDTSDEGVPYEQLRPTYTHEALAKLMEMGLVKHVISQNGDGLHGLSGIPPGSLSELHGNVFLEICEKCGYRYYRPCYVMDDHASLYYEELADSGTTDIVKPKHAVQCERCGLSHRTGRKCEQKGCKGYLKDSIINFGDNLEEDILTAAEAHAKQSDLCLSLGSTMQVTPACELVEMGRSPLRLVVVNRQKTGFDELCYQKKKGEQLGVRVFGDCDLVMREVMRCLVPKEEREAWEKQRGERIKTYDSHRQNP